MLRVMWYFQDCDCVLLIGHVWYPGRHPNLVGRMLKTKKTAGIASIHPPFQTLTVVILWVTHQKMWDHNLLKQCRLLMHVPCSLQGSASFHSIWERVTISFLMILNLYIRQSFLSTLGALLADSFAPLEQTNSIAPRMALIPWRCLAFVERSAG